MTATSSAPPSVPRKAVSRRVPIPEKTSETTQPRVLANATRIRFPRRLPRPVAPLPDTIPELGDAPLPYITNYLLLQDVQTSLLRGLAAVVPKGPLVVPIPSIPREFPCDITKASPAIPPTHVVAVHDGREQGNAFLYPCHSLPLIVYCSNIRSLPTITSAEGTLPVVGLQLPHPQSFHLIRDFVYTRSSSKLLSCLLPVATSLLPSSAFDPVTLSRTIATSMSPSAVLELTRQIYGCWANVCALGISDDAVWRCLQLSWKVALGAMVHVAERARR